MALVILLFTWWNKPSEEELEARRAQQEQAAALERELGETKSIDVPVADFSDLFSGQDSIVSLSNDVMQIQISSKGGKISNVTLNNYLSYATGYQDTVPVELITPEISNYGFIFTSASRRFDTSDYYFEPNIINDSVVEMKLDFTKILFPDQEVLPFLSPDSVANDSAMKNFERASNPSSQFTIRYTLKQGSYIVSMEVLQNGMEKVIPSSNATTDFHWNYRMPRFETGRTFEDNRSSLTFKYFGDSPDDLSSNKNDTESLRQRVKWMAFKNQFFSIVMLPQTTFTGAEVKSTFLKDNPDFLKEMNVEGTLEYSSLSKNPINIDIFFGPNLYPLLKSLDNELDSNENLQLTRLIPMGWPIVRWISTLIIIPTFTWMGTFIHNYGIIILVLTVLLKIILFPLTYKSLVSQAKMRVLQPEIKEINEKYPGQQNAMVRNSKTMALYSKAGASPMSGCIPMLLQWPILIAMFWFFPSCIELRGQSFLWAHNLAAPDVIATLPFTIPFYGNKVSLFCLLMTAVNIIFTWMNMQSQASTNSMPGMKWMMYLMPVMFLFFFNDYAAALSYYYLLSMLISIIMTLIVRWTLNEEKLRAKLLARAAKPAKKSKWVQRLEEVQKQQQALMREQQKRKGR